MLSDLPHDLESEILSRVPSTSLAKLQTTCKRWYALFKDPKFVKMNNLAKAAKEEVMLLMSFGVSSVSVNLHGVHNNFEITGKLKCLKDSKDIRVCQIFHCDGLILCSPAGNNNNRLVVWNPCTGETRSIKPRNCYQWNDIYGLGYGNSESSCHGYKILRFCRYYNFNSQKLGAHEVVEYEIYEFSSDSWRVLDDFSNKWNIRYSSVSLKGKSYWIASDQEADNDVNVLLSFDFTTERFVSFPLPYHQSDGLPEEDIVVLSVVGEEQLAMLSQNIDTTPSEMKLWLSNKIYEAKEVTWSKSLVVDFDKFMLPSYWRLETFLVAEENKVLVLVRCSEDTCNGEIFSVYIVREDLPIEVYYEVTDNCWYNWPRLCSYVPSLVRIQEN